MIPIIWQPTNLYVNDTLLKKIDDIQFQFVSALGLSIEQAFLEHNLAPLRLRRDIAILGFLHRCTLNQVHPLIKIIFGHLPRNGLQSTQKHSHQINHHMHDVRAHFGLYHRSILAMTHIYNNLPQGLVDAPSVKKFQSLLTGMARIRLERHQWYELLISKDWSAFFSMRYYDPDVINRNGNSFHRFACEFFDCASADR